MLFKLAPHTVARPIKFEFGSDDSQQGGSVEFTAPKEAYVEWWDGDTGDRIKVTKTFTHVLEVSAREAFGILKFVVTKELNARALAKPE